MKRETARIAWAAFGGALYGFCAWGLPYIVVSKPLTYTATRWAGEVLEGIGCVHVLVIVCGFIAWLFVRRK